jgi:DNA replicative helicase MCM subunit Mcm2 (Cdc46/Mcm family)
MPKPEIHLTVQTNYVGIIACSKCGYECAWTSKNYNDGKCKRCGKDTKNIITNCSANSKRPLNQTIQAYIRELGGTI